VTCDAIEGDATDTLAAVARLLRFATVRAWAQPEPEEPRSHLRVLGLGIHSASCQALAMLPAEADPEGHRPVQDDVAQLLRAAEELTRSIPVLDQTTGTSPLVVAICEHVREATP